MSQEIKILSIIGIVTLVLVIGAVFMLDKQNKLNSVPEKIDASLLVKDYNHKITADSAKVTLVEFADFQCPACGATFPTIQKIKTDYAGKINFVYRHFPLTQHQNAKPAARAAEAAGEQNKFWEMYEKLFQTQSEWSESNNAEQIFERFATELGLNLEKFKQDISKPEIEKRINDDMTDGLNLKVNSTPTFFLNDEKIEGGLTYEQFKAKIDAKLNE